MTDSFTDLLNAQRLIESGQLAAAVDLIARHRIEEIEFSPSRALLFAVAHARLGQRDAGRRWAEAARRRAGVVRDPQIEARALNILGTIAFEEGSIDEALHHLECALSGAHRQGDQGSVGGSSNTIGVIANIRGQYARAIAAYTTALGAYERAGCPRGLSEVHCNLAITYRDTGEVARALDTANRAVSLAERVGHRLLIAQTRARRGEMRILAGDVALGRREVELALVEQRELRDELGACETLRILTFAMIQDGQVEEAESALRWIIGRAERQVRPLLAAEAGRDLAYLLDRRGTRADLLEIIGAASERFARFGATLELRKLEKLLEAAA